MGTFALADAVAIFALVASLVLVLLLVVLPPLLPSDDDDEEEDDGVVLSFLARKSPHTNRSSAVHWARCNRRRVAWLVMLLTRSVSTVLQGQGQE